MWSENQTESSAGRFFFLCNKKIPLLIALPPGVHHGFSARGLWVDLRFSWPGSSVAYCGGRIMLAFTIPSYSPSSNLPHISAHSVLLTQGVSHPVHLPSLHFNHRSSSQFRFFWPSFAPGCVFLSQTINSSPKKINALERELGAFLAKWVLRDKEHLLLIGF